MAAPETSDGPSVMDPEQTVRRQMMDLLEDGETTARELSQALHIREKEVYGHLEHLARSAGRRGRKLAVSPPECLDCGFVFRERRKMKPPGRCPLCKSTRITLLTYALKPL